MGVTVYAVLQLRRRGTVRRCGAMLWPLLLTLLGACRLSVNGVPVDCRGNIQEAECLERATTALTHSLPPEHPQVSHVVVTCDDDRCDADEGPGRVIVHYANGEQEVVDFGFGDI